MEPSSNIIIIYTVLENTTESNNKHQCAIAIIVKQEVRNGFYLISNGCGIHEQWLLKYTSGKHCFKSFVEKWTHVAHILVFCGWQ